jgi:hypothetical protein
VFEENEHLLDNLIPYKVFAKQLPKKLKTFISKRKHPKGIEPTPRKIVKQRSQH